MLNRITDSITDSSPYQSVVGFFSQNHHVAITPAPTRFTSAAELSDIAAIFNKLLIKKDKMKIAADTKGPQSNEYATHAVMQHFINLVQTEIDKFNALPYKPDLISNYRDMQTFSNSLITLLVISPKDEETLNSVTMDKPMVRSTVLKLGVFTLPVLPVLLLGPGAWAAALGVGAFFAMKPADDFLTSIRAIDWDTESKELLQDFINATKKAHEQLTKGIEGPAVENNNNNNNSR